MLDRRFPAFVAALATAFLLGGCRATSSPASPSPTRIPTPTTPIATPSDDATPLDALEFLGKPAAFENGIVEAIVPVSSGLVAVGCIRGGEWCGRPAVWSSVNGVTWSPPIELPLWPGEIGRPARAAVVTPGGLLIGGSVGVADDRIRAATWRLNADGTAERAGDDPSFADAEIAYLVLEDQGIAAIGSGAYTHWGGFRAWFSSDGLAWRATADAKEEAYPEGTLSVEGGLVAWGPTCSVCVPETAWWRSANGTAWSAGGPQLDGKFAHATVVGATDGGLAAYGTLGIDPSVPVAWFLANGQSAWVPGDPPPGSDAVQIQSYLRLGHGAVLGGKSYRADVSTAFVWLAASGGTGWRPAIVMENVELVQLVGDPTQIGRYFVVGRLPSADGGHVALWSGTVDWAP